MSNIYSFSTEGIFGKTHEDHELILFVGGERIIRSDIANSLLDSIGICGIPREIILICGKPLYKTVHRIVTDSDFDEEYRLRIRQVSPPNISVLFFNEFGDLFSASRNKLSITAINGELSERIRYAGLMKLFKRRNGLIESDGSFHFEKPSGKHCNQFVRSANVLINGPEIFFIATCLLKFLFTDIENIYVDTSAISVIPQMMISIRRWIGKIEFSPNIYSYESYSKLDSFDFKNKEFSLCIISASTSGSMVERMVDKNKLLQNKIVTIFYLGQIESSQNILCNLNKQKSINEIGYVCEMSHVANSCPMCRAGSTCIRIVGDQFLPSTPSVQEYLICKQDIPQGHSEFMHEYVGKGIFSCFRGESDRNGHAHEIYIDVKNIYDNIANFSKYNERLKHFLGQAIPAAVSSIVHANDSASAVMAQVVNAYISDKCGDKIINVFSFDSAERMPANSDSSIVVIVSCISTGRALSWISRLLRERHGNRPITYLIGWTKCDNDERLKTIRSNLSFGTHGLNHHYVICLEKCFLPLRESNTISWNRELQTLKRLIRMFERNSKNVSKYIYERIDVLNNCSSIENFGLTNNLFLPSHNGELLKLKDNFSFWDFNYNGMSVSQSDVYFTISVLLQSLRSSAIPGKEKIKHGYNSTVLSPECFNRLNDGVVQASLLRAAFPSELNYASNIILSRKMADIITMSISHRKDSVGEACLEFILAIADDRLNLHSESLDSVISTKLQTREKNDFLSNLLTYCKMKHLDSKT